MGLDFANPAMLIGSALLAVPLLIHLLNRRRYQLKSWAAMTFLLRAHKKRRRRLRLENFLLLLIRCLIVALLAFAMARPFVPSDSLLAAISAKQRDVVAVLDRSYSMAYESTPGESCFDVALNRIKDLARELDTGRLDTFSCILLGEETDYLVPLRSLPRDAVSKLENPGAVPLLQNPSQSRAELATLAPLLPGEITEIDGQDVEVFLFTDMQARFFGDSDLEAREGTAKLLRQAVEQGAVLRLVDVSSASGIRPNLAVSDLVALDRHVVTGVPAHFTVTVTNYSEGDLANVRGSFVLDGKTSEQRLFDVRARGRATAELTHTFREPGFHSLSFRLEGDRLAVDDERYLSFEVRDSIDVLLVDGAYDFVPFERATGIIGLMLDPSSFGEVSGAEEQGSSGGAAAGRSQGTVFQPKTVDYKLVNSGRESFLPCDCVIFADVEGLATGVVDELLDYVSSGGAVVFFMGSKVDLNAYNTRLFDDPSRRLLPARLERLMGNDGSRDRTAFYQVSTPAFDHPILEIFDDPKLKVLLEVPVFQFVAVEEQLGEETSAARVVAWFADSLGQRFPAILEHEVGRGKVLLVTTSADASWSMIPESPKTYLPLLHEMVYYLTAPDPGVHNILVGEAISRSVAEFPERIVLTVPGGAEQIVSEPVERRRYGRYVLPLEHYPLERAGSYWIDVDSSVSGQRLHESFSANVDSLEGDLEKVNAFELERIFPGVNLEWVDDAIVEHESDHPSSGGGEIWKSLLWILLVLVGLELILSWKFGDYS